MAESPQSIIDKLAADKTTLRRAVKQKGAKHLRVGDFIRATPERGKRQVPALCRRAGVSPDLRIRWLTEYQLDRLCAELAGEDPPDPPDGISPFVHNEP